MVLRLSAFRMQLDKNQTVGRHLVISAPIVRKLCVFMAASDRRCHRGRFPGSSHGSRRSARTEARTAVYIRPRGNDAEASLIHDECARSFMTNPHSLIHDGRAFIQKRMTRTADRISTSSWRHRGTSADKINRRSQGKIVAAVASHPWPSWYPAITYFPTRWPATAAHGTEAI